MEFKGIVFEPGKEGEVVSITTSDFRNIVGGGYERTYNKYGFPDTTVIVNHEGIYLELPRNRGYQGTFIVVKEPENDDIEGYESFSNEEILEIKKVLDNKKNFSSKNKFLEVFFDEKDVPLTIFNYTRGLNVIQINNYDVIETLLASEDQSFLKEAEIILRKIDFANGDVNHFLEHMGGSMADQIANSGHSMFDM